MSKVTRSKLKFLIYILLQETNKINRKFFQILNDFFRTHSSASRAFVTRKRFSACWGNSPIPLERCLRHRAAHPFRMLERQFLPKKRRSESSPRLQKTFTCDCGLHAFCSPRLYAFSSLHSAGHCTGQS